MPTGDAALPIEGIVPQIALGIHAGAPLVIQAEPGAGKTSTAYRVHYEAPSKSGATYAQMSPDTVLARSCALVPPPSFDKVRYFGALAGKPSMR